MILTVRCVLLCRAPVHHGCLLLVLGGASHAASWPLDIPATKCPPAGPRPRLLSWLCTLLACRQKQQSDVWSTVHSLACMCKGSVGCYLSNRIHCPAAIPSSNFTQVACSPSGCTMLSLRIGRGFMLNATQGKMLLEAA